MTYTPSKYWQVLSDRAQQMLDKFGYENFKSSVSLAVYNDYLFNYETQALDPEYEANVRAIWDKLYETYPSQFLDQLVEPSEGTPLAIKYKGRLVSLDLVATITEYARLASCIDFDTVSVVREIGGGYGRIPYVLTQLYPELSYHMYDIEPSLGIAKRYLNSVRGDANIQFHSPDELSGRCDILIAMNCLHEVTKEQVESYFDYAQKNSRYFYFSCWKHTHINADDITWRQEDYPVRPTWKPLYVGQHYMRRDFFEALYQCG